MHNDPEASQLASTQRFTSVASGPMKPESCVPLVVFWGQQDARVTGYYSNHVLEWNKLHGLGGEDVWRALAG